MLRTRELALASAALLILLSAAVQVDPRVAVLQRKVDELAADQARIERLLTSSGVTDVTGPSVLERLRELELRARSSSGPAGEADRNELERTVRGFEDDIATLRRELERVARAAAEPRRERDPSPDVQRQLAALRSDVSQLTRRIERLERP